MAGLAAIRKRREDIFRLMATGMRTSSIASSLQIPERTVYRDIESINKEMAKNAKTPDYHNNLIAEAIRRFDIANFELWKRYSAAVGEYPKARIMQMIEDNMLKKIDALQKLGILTPERMAANTQDKPVIDVVGIMDAVRKADAELKREEEEQDILDLF